MSALVVVVATGCASVPATPTGVVSPPTRAPSRTATPSTTPTATSSPTPTLHPLTIESMRGRTYPGSDLTIAETLAPGSNYARYLASYFSDGLRIDGLLTVPAGDPPSSGWPVIIFNHGYIPPDEYRTTERYIAYVHNLARSGYIVFRPDYRGHAESQGIASGAYGSPGYVIDVLNAVATLRRFPAADPRRVGMWGHSMGGYITLRAMVIDRELQAGVIWAGVVAPYPDLVSRWRRPGGTAPTPGPVRGWRGGLLETYGSPEENPAFWASISANAFLDDLAGPLQLHHGTADRSVPFEFSEELYQEALEAGATVELYLYPEADHNLSAPFSVAMQRTLDFYQTHLKGSP